VTPNHEQIFPAVLRSLEPSARVLLLALTELDYPTRILRCVAALATALDKDLHVLRVLLPLRSRPSRPLAQRTAGDHCAEREHLALLGTSAWCARTLLNPPIGREIEVRVGDFASVVSEHAREVNAACVMLAPSKTGWAGTMTALARNCRQPVVVATHEDEPMARLMALERG
jgi:hypothetical protein